MSNVAVSTIELCAGVGMLGEGLRAGLAHLGIAGRVACYVEREAAASAQLVTLMEAEVLDQAPIWSDLTTFDGKPWRGKVDCIAGGFPCQPWSAAGKKEGTADARWIWPDIARIICEVEPSFCWFENVPGLVQGGGLEHVLFDLARLGFDAECCAVSAASVGASHERNRVFILAVHPERGFRELWQSSRCDGFTDGCSQDVGNATGGGRQIGSQLHGEHDRQDVGSGRDRVRQELENTARPVERGRRGGRVSESGGAMADTSHGLIQEPRRGSSERNGAGSAVEVLEHAESTERRGELETVGTGSRRAGPSGTGEYMADCDGPDAQGGGNCGDEERRQIENGYAGLESGELFAPGPADPRWPAILERFPWLAPATQCGVLGVVDGLALVVDESRRDQLREVGNGCVSLAVAVAFVGLARRAVG